MWYPILQKREVESPDVAFGAVERGAGGVASVREDKPRKPFCLNFCNARCAQHTTPRALPATLGWIQFVVFSVPYEVKYFKALIQQQEHLIYAFVRKRLRVTIVHVLEPSQDIFFFVLKFSILDAPQSDNSTRTFPFFIVSTS